MLPKWFLGVIIGIFGAYTVILLKLSSVNMQVEQKETVLEELLEETVASRVLSFAWSATNRPEISDISLVTHASVKKLDRLVVQLQVWTGPVSVAIYLKTRDDIQQLSACISQHPDAFRRTTVHALLEPNRSSISCVILPPILQKLIIFWRWMSISFRMATATSIFQTSCRD